MASRTRYKTYNAIRLAALNLGNYDEQLCEIVDEAFPEAHEIGEDEEYGWEEVVEEVEEVVEELDKLAGWLTGEVAVPEELEEEVLRGAAEEDELRENAVKTLLHVETGRRVRANGGIVGLKKAYRQAVSACQRHGWFSKGKITDKGVARLNGCAPHLRAFEAARARAVMEGKLLKTAASLHAARATSRPSRANPTGVPLSGRNVVVTQVSATQPRKRIEPSPVLTHEYRPVIRVPQSPEYGSKAGKTVRPRIQLSAARLEAAGALEQGADGKPHLTRKGREVILPQLKAEAERRVLDSLRIKGMPEIQYVAGEIIPEKRYRIADAKLPRGGRRFDANPRGVDYRREMTPKVYLDFGDDVLSKGFERFLGKMQDITRDRAVVAGTVRSEAAAFIEQIDTLTQDDLQMIYRIVQLNPSRFTAIRGKSDRSWPRAVNQMRSLLEDAKVAAKEAEVRRAPEEEDADLRMRRVLLRAVEDGQTLAPEWEQWLAMTPVPPPEPEPTQVPPVHVRKAKKSAEEAAGAGKRKTEKDGGTDT